MPEPPRLGTPGAALRAELPDTAALETYVAHALAAHPSVRAAEERVLAARARVVPAGTLPDPMLMAGIQNLPVEINEAAMGQVAGLGLTSPLERVFAAWPAGGATASFDYPAAPAAQARTIYLVDKPKAAQSSFAIGLPGPARDTPDYYALQVMNRILGGHIQSRLSNNIRETKGWSYGVGSGFAFGRGPGAFSAGGEIVTAKTDSALLEFMKELEGVRGGRPFTEAELQEAREAIVQGLPRNFASVGALAGALTTLQLYDLPQDYYQRYAEQVQRVTAADLDRVADAGGRLVLSPHIDAAVVRHSKARGLLSMIYKLVAWKDDLPKDTKNLHEGNAVVYLFNVINKSGTVWRNGDTVHYVLHLDRMITGLAIMAMAVHIYLSHQTLLQGEDPVTVVIVEQDVTMAQRVSQRIYCLQEGRVSLQGRSDALTREQISQAYFGV